MTGRLPRSAAVGVLVFLQAGSALVGLCAQDAPPPNAPAQAPAPLPSSKPPDTPASAEAKVIGPHMIIAKPTFEAGDVVRGQVAKATFEIRNTGNQTLKILDARPGCGCTVASFDSTIEPGQTGKVTAQVKTETFRGPIDKSVSVTSNDVTTPMASLHVKANVVGSVEILPTAYVALPHGSLMDYTGKLLVRKDRTESGKLEISDVTATAPWLRVASRKLKKDEPRTADFPVDATAGDWILDVSLAPDAPLQGGGQQIQFKTGLPREPQVSIPMAIAFSQAIQSDPMSVIMFITPGSTRTEGGFRVAVRPDLAKEALKATADPDRFTVSVEPDGDRHYKAKVAWSAGDDPAGRFGNVILTAGREKLTVPVRVLEKKAAPTAAASTPTPPAGP